MPMWTASGSQPTMFVVRRTRVSSSIATIATTYGGGRFGSHCWKFTVTPTTTPRPETSTTSRSVLWQSAADRSGRVLQRSAVLAVPEAEHALGT